MHKFRVEMGFTLIELMVTVAILAILLGLAAPSFSDIMLTSRLTDAGNRLVSSAAFSRSEAIKRNTVVILCMSADVATATSPTLPTCTTTGGWQQGWIIKTATEVLAKDLGLASGFKINGSVSTISFDPTGVGTTQATLTVCRFQPAVGSQEREVSIGATGKATSRKTTTGTCV